MLKVDAEPYGRRCVERSTCGGVKEGVGKARREVFEGAR